MSARVFVAALVLCAAWSSRASAHDVGVRVDGACVARAELEAALALELGTGWAIAADEAPALRVEISVADCEAATWSARVVDGAGVVLRGPAELAMAGFPPASRARIAALWIAEWLATVAVEAEAESEVEAESEMGAESEAETESEVEAETGTEPAAVVDTASDAGPAERPSALGADVGTSGSAVGPPDPPLRVRFVALASFRQVPETPASLGGGELAVQLARGGELGLGVELGAGIEGGKQWSYDMLVLRGSLSAFALLAPADWVEIDLGARAGLEHLADYTRHALRERLHGQLHGTIGGFVRTLLFLTRELAVAVDLELGGALAPVTYTIEQPPGYELPNAWDDLLGGFFFAARAGIVVQ